MYKPLSNEPVKDVEARIAQKWEDENLLERSIENRNDGPRFTFYEGPPTANGRPGIHHVLARTLKDTVVRL